MIQQTLDWKSDYSHLEFQTDAQVKATQVAPA